MWPHLRNAHIEAYPLAIPEGKESLKEWTIEILGK